jgi:uncharacterized protein (TIGR02996 family)
MLDREPFLKAIFAAPIDDLPRLVFADYLDEHGDPGWAELIRLQCELANLPAGDERVKPLTRRELALVGRFADDTCVPVSSVDGGAYHRGFRRDAVIPVSADALIDPDAFRRLAVERHPEWYGATRLKLVAGTVTTPGPLHTILTSPVTEQVVELDLSGRTEEVASEAIDIGDEKPLTVTDYVVRPAISIRMIEHLCQMPEARRLVALDLRLNNLDNDALRALARSTNLIRLERLSVYDPDSTRFKGGTWQQVVARFGQHRLY